MIETDSIDTNQFFNKSIKNLKISSTRLELLKSIAYFITSELKKDKKINLNFICTHNSRRSQLAQVWSHFSAHYYKIKNVESFSGGTAVTAFFRNTVKTLQEVGFQIQISEFSHRNPEYVITYKDCTNPIIGFSKLYDNDFNKKPYIAITTCSNTDENCPFIPDAINRFHVPFNDPKTFDNSLYQAEKYLEANTQIAGEIHYIYKLIKQLI